MILYTVKADWDIGGQLISNVQLFSTEELAQSFYKSLIDSLKCEEDKEEVFISYIEVL